MPIFQDPDNRQLYDLWSDDQQTARDERRQDPYCWIDYHEVNNGQGSSDRSDISLYHRPPEALTPTKRQAHDREELIHYIKTAETPKWPYYYSLGISAADRRGPHTPERFPTESAQRTKNTTPEEQFRAHNAELASPAEIERPRSALHSGDFREGNPQLDGQQQLPRSPLPSRSSNLAIPLLASSPTAPWFPGPSFPSRTQTAPAQALEKQVIEGNRPPGPSLGSFSSSYVLKTPTSPLVHQANNTDLDFASHPDSGDQPALVDKANRRRTLPPDTFRDLQTFSGQSGVTNPTRWGSLSHQSHHPRRSLASSYSLQLASSLQGSSPRPRRPSLSSEISCRIHAPMVGSYEESILRGRMSTCPSKPLDFTAQIGVLGKSRCKASLKCPPHVTVQFPAVFYSYPTSGSGRSISDDSPSPYVGTIDLENSLPRDNSRSRRRRRHPSPIDIRNSQNADDAMQNKPNDQESLRRREKKHRRAESPKSPPGGSYRIPPQGQLQVIIKNPNKTAVKLFLVPYDLSDMEPGTKTFIRQRSYSAGPILDMPLSARSNYGTDRPEASLTYSEDPKDKPVLRYLIHLNICCPSRGRYYLHSSIRVVFANRVPDGKEKLRNEIQHPHPRYSPYKTSRESNPLRVTPSFCAGRASRGSSPHPNGNNRTSNERQPHPFQPIPSIRPDIVGLGNSMAMATRAHEPEVYNKLSRGDAGYGGYPSGSPGSFEGESLLARKLRGLDVQKPDDFAERRRL
ncbi:uncharacterized protein BJX67DRAFT_387982 [Aspergillus lucknowensis]|uniref:Atos-like conserved domain-containing protein n=1 Tax=Aspergillus lucknowensis TaxID=176173 RepID=A0ABR4M5A0_9EURO